MVKKRKVLQLLIGLIIALIFLGWLVNLKYVWQKKSNQDEFTSLIKELILQADKSFKDLNKKLKEFKKPETLEYSVPLTNEELGRFKKKVLEYNF